MKINLEYFNRLRKLKPPKSKKSNQQYLNWLKYVNDSSRLKLNSLNSKEIGKKFSSFLTFKENGLEGKFGVGSNEVNNITLKNNIDSLKKMMKIRDSFSSLVIGTSNNVSSFFLRKIINLFKETDLRIYVFNVSEIPISLLSLTVSTKDKCSGIYIEQNENFFRMKWVKKNGKLANHIDYYEISKFVNKTPLPSEKKKDNSKIKLTIISEKIIEEYENHIILRKFQNFLPNKKILITSTSKSSLNYSKKLLLEKRNLFYLQKSENLDNPKIYNVNNPKSFIEAFKFSKKNDINFILNISGDGSKMSIAYKRDKNWKIYSKDDIFLFIIFLIKELKLMKNNNYIKIPKIRTKCIDQVLISLNLKYKEDFKSEDTQYAFFNKSQEISINNFTKCGNVFTFLLPFIYYLSTYDLTIDEIIKKIKSTNDNFYLFRIEKNVERKVFSNIISLMKEEREIGVKKITSLKIIEYNEYINTIKINLLNGEILVSYNDKFKTIDILSYIYEGTEDDVFIDKSEIDKFFKVNLSSNQILDKRKKKIIKSVGFTFSISSFVLVITLTFLFVFDVSEIKNSFLLLEESFDDPWVYLLILEIFLIPLSNALVFFYIFKKIDSDVSFSHILVGTYAGSVVSSVFITAFVGGTFILFYLRRKGYRTSEILPAVGVQATVLMLFRSIWALIMIPIGNNFLASVDVSAVNFNPRVIKILSWIGFSWVFASFLIFFAAGYFKWFYNFILIICEKVFFLFRKEEQYFNLVNNIDYNSKKIQKNFTYFFHKPFSLLVLGVIYFFSIFVSAFSLYFSINLSLTSYNEPILSPKYFFLTSSLSTLVVYSNTFIPLPAGIGFSEIFLVDILEAVISGTDLFSDINVSPDKLSQQISFIERLFDNYIPLFISAAFFIFSISSFVDRKKRVKKARI